MSDERGYTIAEAVIAIFIIGLMIGMIWPLFQVIKTDASDQSDHMESSQWLTEQMERLTANCKHDRSGWQRKKLAQTHTLVQMKWECKKIDRWLMQITVEVQWKSRKGMSKKQIFKTHRFQAS